MRAGPGGACRRAGEQSQAVTARRAVGIGSALADGVTTETSTGDAGQNELCSDVLAQLRNLDALLKKAVERARALYAAGEEDAAFHGVYISEQEIDSLLEREGAETLGSDATVSDALSDFMSGLCPTTLGERWEFTDFDNAVVVLALAPEVSARYERVYAYLQDDVTRRKPTVDLALNLLCDSTEARIERRGRFAPEAPLIRSGLLRLLPDPSQVEPPLLAHYMRLDERAIRALLGDEGLDSRLATFSELIPAPAERDDLAELDEVVKRLLTFTARAKSEGRRTRFLFSGPATSSKRQAAEAFAVAGRRALLAADLQRYPSWQTEPAEVASLLTREATLSDATIYVSGLKADMAEAAAAKSFLATLVEYEGVIVVASESPVIAVLAGGDQFLHVPFALPAYDERLSLWQRLTEASGIKAGASTLTRLATNFTLAPEQVEAAVGTARQRLEWRGTSAAKPGKEEADSELLAAARSQTGVELAALTTRLKPLYGWKDIVLPADQLEQLLEICQRVTHRQDVLEKGGFGKKLSAGKGVAVLFAGPSGTGKTMAAEVIANELGLNLFRIDLSRVVSKYIGETEQNLERIFTAADRSNSVLLFDEADALFGKRSAVHDAHDRYANIEVSYLLQKMEQYEGIAILTSNLRGNIDEGFVRRLAFIVHFPFPEEETRAEIWRRVWPQETRVDPGVDFAALAERFRLSGGNIRNVGLAAAFLAAAESRPVQMSDILRATRTEYAKVGRILTETELEEVVL